VSATAATPAVGTPTENDAQVFEMLRSAVTLAKNHQIRTLKSLTSMLETLYPGKEDLIKQALALWGRYERSKPSR